MHYPALSNTASMEGACHNMLLQLQQEEARHVHHQNSSFHCHEFTNIHDDEEDHINAAACDDSDNISININHLFSCDDDCKNLEFCNYWPDDDQDPLERKLYWDSQEALLQVCKECGHNVHIAKKKSEICVEEILQQYNSTASRLREEISRHIESAREANYCDCKGPKFDGCAKCLRARVVNLLSCKGFNASLCTSSWKRTPTRPGGSHEYIEVVATTQVKKKKIKFLIEIEFRDEFKMAKACDEYDKLIDQLPETYIGKPEHLNAIVRVMCDAAKRSTSEKKIHLGPWRKRSFMEMKWSASYEKRFNHQSPTTAVSVA